jgi:maltooligosyltrehalose trehalohydrolase
MGNARERRKLPVGAEVLATGGVHFRVWAPLCRRVQVIFEEPNAAPASQKHALELKPEADGYFSGIAEDLSAGARYGFCLDGGSDLIPDPASRSQPEGPHGLSQVVDPDVFAWTDGSWKGVGCHQQVLYEMHIGTFTRAGTWEAAADELAALADLGVTVLELMPVAEFPGQFGWGYDGVCLFAPSHLYGSPDAFRAFVDRAHAVGLGVILDVVYNHLGPDGNYLKEFSSDYFSQKYENEWGEALNFDGENSVPVRAFFIANAGYWVREFHLDGLRLDATQQIFDDSPEHLLTAVTRESREAAEHRSVYVTAENEHQHTCLVRPVEQGGFGIDALWNDDFHHSAVVALTGHNSAYYTDYLGNPQEFLSAAKWGYLYQGQYYSWQKQRRGTAALDLRPDKFIHFLENHDQVANTGLGWRLHTVSNPGRYRAMTALLLLGPQTPLLFQGQEFASSSPFFYFADHRPELARLVHQGRQKFLAQFRNLALPEVQTHLPDPSDVQTFERSKLDLGERERHSTVYALHRDLLRLRRQDPVFCAPRRGGIDGAVLGPELLLLRFFSEDGNDRLLLVNFGRDVTLCPAPEPLLAPPADSEWEILWSSEELCYGGAGTPPLEADMIWRIPGEAAVALIPCIRARKETDDE